jgi:hypothetical protein
LSERARFPEAVAAAKARKEPIIQMGKPELVPEAQSLVDEMEKQQKQAAPGKR